MTETTVITEVQTHCELGLSRKNKTCGHLVFSKHCPATGLIVTLLYISIYILPVPINRQLFVVVVLQFLLH